MGKKCKKCGEEKSREEFYKLSGSQYKKTWDVRDSYCKPCRTKYQSQRHRNIKKQSVEYLGGECKDCGLKTTHYSVYDFHHEYDNKDFSPGKVGGKSFLSIKYELDKCTLLCSNCHRIRHEELEVL